LLTFRLTTPAGLFDPTQEAAYLPQGLFFAGCENAFESRELLFIPHDRAENVPNSHRAIDENDGRCLAGGD